MIVVLGDCRLTRVEDDVDGSGEKTLRSQLPIIPSMFLLPKRRLTR